MRMVKKWLKLCGRWGKTILQENCCHVTRFFILREFYESGHTRHPNVARKLSFYENKVVMLHENFKRKLLSFYEN